MLEADKIRKSSDSTAGCDRGRVMREHVARHRAPVLYGDTRDEWGMSQSAGHTFDGGFASGSARVHNGDHHGTVNHYNYAGSGAPLPDRSDDQSKVAIALAMESLSFTQIDVRQASVRIAHTSTCKWLFDRPEYSNEQLCLDYACHGNDRDVVNVLLDHNADVNALWAPRTFIHLPESARPRSLIFATSSTGDADGLRLLLDSGADANVSNGEEFYDALAHHLMHAASVTQTSYRYFWQRRLLCRYWKPTITARWLMLRRVVITP